MVRLFSLTLLLIVIALASTYAQTGSITGRITSDGSAVAYATIRLENKSIGGVADESGNFVLENVPVGDANILIRSVGNRSITQTVSVTANQVTEIEINMTKDLLGLEEVVVSGNRYKVDKKEAPVVVNVISAKMLKATQSIAISDGLNYQPGVRVETNCQNCGFTQVRLNGLAGGYSQILINSRAVFSALNSVYGLDQIPTNIVEQIEVVRGGGSALYGSNAIGGTINIITKEPVENSWEAGSYFSLIGGEATDHVVNVNGSIVSEDLNSGVTLYGTFRDRESFDANNDGFTELVELKNNILGAKAFVKLSDRSKILADFSAIEEYRRGGDRLDLAPHFTDITEELDHNTVFTGLTYDFWTANQRDKISVYVSSQITDRRSFYGGLGGGRTREDSLLAINAYGNTEDRALVAGAQYTRSLGSNDIFILGVENQRNDTQDEITGYNRIVDQKVNALGIFGQYEWKPNLRFTTLIGARYDLTNVDGFYQIGNIESTSNENFGVLSPRITLMYKLNKNMQLRAGYARGFRAPQAFNEDLHISSVGGEPQFVILSNGLQKETSNAYTASVNLIKDFGTAQTNFLVEGFYTQLNNPFVQVSTGAALPNGSILEEVRNGQGAVVSGANFEAGYSPSDKFSFALGGTAQTATYDQTQVLFEPEGTLSEEALVAVDEFVRTPNLYGYFNSKWSLTENLEFDFTGTYTGSMIVPRVVSESGFFALNESDAFLDVNIKATYHFDLKDDFHIELSGGAKNVFNSYQDDFERGATRDSDYIYGPAAPRSIFLSIKIGKLH
ncbi:MAG: outer membrane receptor for ferrienterochelin and colicins [Cyclobacteriaceae bacterium]|jgi:outer membrane receptor for ferrienterochelin and colicins